MLYLAFPATIAAMLAYMFYHAGFRMRRARVLEERAKRKAWFKPKAGKRR